MAGSLSDRLAIQSWCFRGYKTHEQVIDALKRCGLADLEISNAHVNPAVDAGLDAVLDLYRSSGVTISSTGLFVVQPDEARSRKVFDFVRLAGVPAFTADIEPGCLQLAERLCEEYGVRLAVHNHGRRHRHGPAWALADLLARASPNIGLCLDTAWAIDAGDDPVAVAKKFADRLYGVHVKDFVFDRAGKSRDVIVGEGNLNLEAFLRTLIDVNFTGYFTLEYSGDVNDPVPSTTKCVEAIRRTLDRIAAPS